MALYKRSSINACTEKVYLIARPITNLFPVLCILVKGRSHVQAKRGKSLNHFKFGISIDRFSSDDKASRSVKGLNQAHIYYWSLLYSAILRSRADSLRSHVILHVWLAFYSAFFKYPPKWCTYNAGMAGATWNCSRLGASPVYTIQPCTMSLHAKPHT